MKKLLKTKKVIISGVVLGALLVVGGFSLARGKQDKILTVPVVNGSVIQQVSVTGKVASKEAVDLAFEKGGKVGAVYAQVGTHVRAGDVLVKQENSEVYAGLLSAQAALKSAQAKLAELKRGTRPEELAVSEVEVKNAEQALLDSKNNLVDKIRDAFTKTDDAIRNQTDSLFNNPKTSNPTFNYSNTDSQLKSAIETGRVLMEQKLIAWQITLGDLTVDSKLDDFVRQAKEVLAFTREFLDKVGLAVNAFSVTSGVSQTTIDGWKTNVLTARTNVNTAVGNVSAADEKFQTAVSSLALAKQQLILEKAGSTPEAILAAEADVEQAQATVLNNEALLSKTVLRSPVTGLVTKQEAKVGEIVAANTNITSVIGDQDFQIETYIPEADIAKIKVGNSADVTLDAYGNSLLFRAKVISVDPAETIVDGVSTYLTKLQFLKEDQNIKSGMTANIDITTAKRENVLVIPQRATFVRSGQTFVGVVFEDQVNERGVELGLRGSDGNVEVVSGLSEGELVSTSSF